MNAGLGLAALHQRVLRDLEVERWFARVVPEGSFDGGDVLADFGYYLIELPDDEGDGAIDHHLEQHSERSNAEAHG